MSLPPGFLDELRTRLTLSQVVGRKVTWDMRKSNMAKGDFWAPCPFHQERTASFHVDDRKGFYYCFGCHAKGDALTFVKETENLSFIEAVEVLAREAGMAMPERDPRAVQQADRRTQLAGVLEEAVKWFRLQLKTAAAAEARDYLIRRRLSPEAQDRWEIGFAPDQRQGLFHALTGKGIAPELIVEAGLCAKPDDGGPPYDRFRGRIIFPIRDGRGRAISLGGRALSSEVRAKYLNGPETVLFDKGRNLFNLGPAREAAGKGLPLIVAEGYMDVIALSEAGFRAAVAPLGTAVTEDQLRLMWRVADEPVIALDGDSAGIRAGLRVVDLALPLLEAGKGLRFALLPGGMDPDDLIKAQGAAAMQKVLDEAKPMVSLLWQRETEGRVFDSPERRAGLDKSLRVVLARISDSSIRSHYAEEIRRLRAELFAPSGPVRPFRPGFRKGPPLAVAPLPASRASALAAAAPQVEHLTLARVLIATLIAHPALIARFESDLEVLDLPDADLRILAGALLRHAHDPDGLLPALQARHARELDSLSADAHVRSAPPVRKPEDSELALLCVAEGLAKLDARRGAEAEIAEAMEDVEGLADEGLTWRLSQAAEARNRAERSRLDETDGGEDRAALSRHLQSLIDGEIWRKKNR